MDRPADTGDNEHHHQAQRVELQAEINLQTADGEPVFCSFRDRWMKTVGIDENQSQDETSDNRADGDEAADGFAPQSKKRYDRH